MCPCYKEEFFAASNEYIHHSIHFKCKCDMEEKCNCKSGLSHEVCGFCFSVRYLLNVLSFYKICIK